MVHHGVYLREMVGINGLQLYSNLFTNCNFGPDDNFVKFRIYNSSYIQFQIKLFNYLHFFNACYIHRICRLCLIICVTNIGGPMVIFLLFLKYVTVEPYKSLQGKSLRFFKWFRFLLIFVVL